MVAAKVRSGYVAYPMMNEIRAQQLVRQAIKTFSLDLHGLVVLTEAASGLYALTPLIAACAGADRVLALTRDSRFGSATAMRDMTMALARRWAIADRVKVLLSRDDEQISTADIVTNLGFVRPLDMALLTRLKPTVAIPLMWETWEFRPADLDLEACRRLGIPVLGTNEHVPELQTIGYIGHLSLKLLFDLDIEIFRSRIVVIGSGEFASVAVTALEGAGAFVVQLVPTSVGRLEYAEAREVLRDLDAVVIVEHHSRTQLIGQGSSVTATNLAEWSPGVVVAHICGAVDREDLRESRIQHAPAEIASAGHMSVATDYVGPRPLIELHTAGLRVGEALARARLHGLTAREAEDEVLQSLAVAQGFVGYHDAVQR